MTKLKIVGICTSCKSIISINSSIPITFVNGELTVNCSTCPETIFQPTFDINLLAYNVIPAIVE
jgi:hypothetical protein